MPKGYSIDLDALHSFLFRKADRLGRIKLNQTQLSKDFGITKFTMSRVITKMVDSKRIKRLTSNLNNRGLFVVEDPEIWNDVYKDQE